jgi:hypothetical protein
MIFLKVVEPDSETPKRAPADIEGPLPITVPRNLTSSPAWAIFGSTYPNVTRVGLLVVVAGAVAAAPRRRRMPPIAMETQNRTRRH